MVKKKMCIRILCVILSVLIIFGSVSIMASAVSVGGNYKISQAPTKYKYIKYWGDDGSTMSPASRGWETFYKRTIAETGEPAYCLEFGKDFANNTYTDAKSLTDTAAWQNATNTARRGVVLASIYGYPNCYSEYGDAAYYATQVIMWEYMLGYRTSASNDIYSGITGGYDQNNKCCRFILSMQSKGYSDIFEAYCGILTEMSKHTMKPYFGSANLKLDFNPSTGTYSKTFIDTNGILSEFNIIESTGLSVEKNGSTITVSSNAPISGSNVKTVKLVKRLTDCSTGVALYATGNPDLQTLICGTVPDPQYVTYNVYTDIGHIKVTKESEDGNVENIKFNIKCDSIGFNKDYLTNSDGVIDLTGLPVGCDYTITEYTPDEYVPTSSKTVTLSSDAVPNVHFYNILKKGSVTVTKTDAVTGKVLSGAEFVICKGDIWNWDNLVWNDTINDDYFVTDENGKLTVSGLEPGSYILREGEAPNGYITSDTQYPFTIIDDNSNISFDITNERKVDVDLEINKTDDNGSKLSGAEISVYEADDSFNITNENAVFVGTTSGIENLKIDNLAFGYYVIRETKTPERCATPENDVVANIEIGPDDNDLGYAIAFYDVNDNASVEGNTITMINHSVGVVVEKVDADTNTPLLGAKFEIKSSENDVFTVVTGEDGRVVINGLKANTTYTYKELSAPLGYYCDKNIYSFTTDSYGNISGVDIVSTDAVTGLPKIVFENEKTEFTVIKVDENDNPVVGAVFDIYDETNALICEGLVTDASGKIVLQGVKEGNYYAVETKAPDGYALTCQDRSELSFSISANAAKTLTVYDQRTFVTIVKVGAGENIDDVRSLSGAEFKLYKADGNTLEPVNDATYITDENGRVTIYNLLVNTRYCFVEAKAPVGFYTDDTPHYFIVRTDGTVVDGSGNVLTSKTVDAATGDVTLKNDYVVSNQRTSFTIKKVDGNTNEIITTGATFEIYKADENGNYVKSPTLKVKEGTTGVDGTWVVRGLPEGVYYAVEKISPNGYIPNPLPIKFTIGFAGENSISVANNKTSVTLKKVDANNSETVVSGVKFDLFVKGMVTDTKVNETPLITNENGEIKVEGLEVGKEYYFVEASTPNGYYTDTGKHLFKVNEQGKPVDEAGNDVDKLIVKNTPTSFNIAKIDSDTHERIANVVFAVYANDGTFKGSYTTDESGNIHLYKLPEGEYYAVETVFPSGYIQDSTHHEFVINNTTSDETLVVENKKTSVTLSKVDLVNGEPVRGATIEIYNEAGECVYSGISDEAGTVTVDYLPIGSYTFKETINPDGYVLNSETYDFTINADGSITNGFAITNAPTEVIITKTDADGNLLEGATIGVYDYEGNEIYRGVTNELGQIKVQYLKSGTYSYREILAPDGYKLNRETYEFTVNRDGSVEGENTMTNESTSVVITKTDENGVPLAGSTIAIYNEDGEEVFRDITNDFGKISVFGLHYGNYTYKELECPDGYVLDESVYEFSIDTEGNVAGDNVIVNIATSVVITKTDKNGTPIEGATIGIYDVNDELLFTLMTDERGQATARNLVSGRYYFQEILPAAGYEINSDKHSFEITREGKVLGENSLENSLTKVVIKKTDKDNNPLAGAEIGIYNDSNELVTSGVSNENGEFIVYGLKPGKYLAKELKAPKGYLLSSEGVEFTIDDYGIARGSFIITNELEPVNVNLPQTGSSYVITSTCLSGALIAVSSAILLAFKCTSRKRREDCKQ